MGIVCEPLKDGIKLMDRIDEIAPAKVLLVFWHGIGDLVMFMTVFNELQAMFQPGYFVDDKEKKELKTEFVLGLPKGLTHEEILPEDIPYHLVTAEEVNDTPEKLPYDLVAKITFPMNEGQTEYTKAEWCCIHEIGIEPVWGHEALRECENRIVAVHFQITCLPDSCNPDRDTAEKIWNDVIEAGYIPIESHFQHVFHNPVNKKFDFIDATVRRCKARASSLAGLLQNCAAFVGVVSGPFHVALASMPKDRVFLLEKDFKRECFTKLDIPHADLRNYKGEVKTFLKGLKK